MFERNKVETTPEQTFVPVEITLADGERIKGRIATTVGRPLTATLNADGGFVEFEAYGGERTLLAKRQLASIQLVGVPKAMTLQQRGRAHADFDPHAILGISVEASWDEVRQAYVQLTKTYHPDRYAGAVLPPEVREYLETSARRINAAYAALETPHKVMKQAVAQRSTPVFTSQPRG